VSGYINVVRQIIHALVFFAFLASPSWGQTTQPLLRTLSQEEIRQLSLQQVYVEMAKAAEEENIVLLDRLASFHPSAFGRIGQKSGMDRVDNPLTKAILDQDWDRVSVFMRSRNIQRAAGFNGETYFSRFIKLGRHDLVRGLLESGHKVDFFWEKTTRINEYFDAIRYGDIPMIALVREYYDDIRLTRRII
jgi:hypothetical protein